MSEYIDRSDRDDRYTGETTDIDPDVIARVRQQYLGTVVGLPAWSVDGGVVRCPGGIGDIDFVEGGNGARYGYIPPELWVEDIFLRNDLAEGACILVHEGDEFFGMRDDGLDYSHAHDHANQIEWSLREAIHSGEVEGPDTPEDAARLADEWLRNTGLGEQ